MKYYVIQRYYDSGKVQTEIITEEDDRSKECRGGLQEERENYDFYMDEFKTEAEAKAFALGVHMA